jgi:myo-inositol-1(or 4)-monophosphatase
MKLNIALLKEIATEIQMQVRPLAGKPEAAEITGQGAGGDRTRKIDLVAEDIIFSKLKSSDVTCTVISEEKGVVKLAEEETGEYLIVDSVDGSNNALRGVPFFAVSLAVADIPRLSGVQQGLVMDLYHGETFWAEQGKGAHKDGEVIETSELRDVKEAVIGVDLSAKSDGVYLDRLSGILSVARHIRHFGANALEICYVACGRFDAFIDIRRSLRVTDMAAAHLILKEAGGEMIDDMGRALDSPAGSPTDRVSFVAANNSTLASEIMKLLGH